MSLKKMDRRLFLATGAGFGVVALVARLLGSDVAHAQRKSAAPAAGAAAAKEMKLVDENDPVAKALKYSHDATKASKDLQIKRGVTEFKDQHCASCAFYKDPKGKIGADNVGTCQLIATGKVKEKGWCTSWSLKA